MANVSSNASLIPPNPILPSVPPFDHLNCLISSLVLLWGWSIHGPIPTLRHNQRLPTSLHPIRVDAGCRSWVVRAHACLISTLEVDVFDVKGVDVTWEVAQDRQTNINAEVYTAASDEGHA